MGAGSTSNFELGTILGVSSSLLDAIPEPLFIKNTDARYLWANTAWADLMGLDPNRIAGSSDDTLFAQDFALQHSEPERRALSTGQKAQKILAIEVSGRPKKHIQLTAVPITTPDEHFNGVLGLAHDITARIEADTPGDQQSCYQTAMSLCTRSLLMSDTADQPITSFLRHLGELSNAHSVTIFQNYKTSHGDLQARKSYCSIQPEWQDAHQVPKSLSYRPALLRWHLLLSTDLPLEGTAETLPPEERAILAAEAIQSVLLLPLRVAGAFWGFIRMADYTSPRHWHDWELQTLSVAAESLSAFLMRKQTEEALRRKIEEQDALWTGTPDLLYIKDKDSVYLAANPAFAELNNLSCDEICGKTDFDIYPPKVAGKLRAEDRTVIKTGEALKSIEHSLEKPTGTTIQTITTKAPLRDPTGAVTGIIGITHDVTERAELERQVRQSQKMESIGTMAAGIAHDFNNLLTSMLGFGHLAIPKLTEHSDIHRYVTRIVGAAEHAKKLVRQLLTFSRQAESEKQVILLTPIFKETVKFLHSSLPAHIEIVSSFPEDIDCVHADPTQMHQVLMNLCVNAGHAMPKGGTLTITLEHVDAEPGPADDASPRRWIQLTVADTGCGMDEATQARIFEPFFTTKEAGTGTGLGLSTVYGIIKDCGGTIEVESAPGNGTRFRLRLPATDQAPEQLEEHTTRPSQTGSETVLFVDDDPIVVELGQTVLEEAGYTVLTAADGAEALSLCERHPDEIALVVTDTTMPRMTGPQLAHHLLTLQPNVRLVLSSGHLINEDDRCLVEESGGAILKKPFIPVEILATVRRVLDAK